MNLFIVFGDDDSLEQFLYSFFLCSMLILRFFLVLFHCCWHIETIQRDFWLVFLSLCWIVFSTHTATATTINEFYFSILFSFYCSTTMFTIHMEHHQCFRPFFVYIYNEKLFALWRWYIKYNDIVMLPFSLFSYFFFILFLLFALFLTFSFYRLHFPLYVLCYYFLVLLSL